MQKIALHRNVENQPKRKATSTITAPQDWSINSNQNELAQFDLFPDFDQDNDIPNDDILQGPVTN